MFEFGRDLKRVFSRAKERREEVWLELIGADLLEAEARQQSIEAGRVSCAEPVEANLRAAVLWREHARRTGKRDSVMRSLHAASSARRDAVRPERAAAGAVEMALSLILKADLYGGTAALAAAGAALDEAGPAEGLHGARIAAAHARLSARRARQPVEGSCPYAAAALLDAALHGLENRPETAAEAAELRLERATLSLEVGLRRRDALALDLAGRDLRRLVEDASPDFAPLTRARALAMCGVGMTHLAGLACNLEAMEQGRSLLLAAADVFPVDHSPLDWVAIQLALALSAERTGEPVEPVDLRQAELLTQGEGLIIGALAADARAAAETRAADRAGDLNGLKRVETRLRRRLARGQGAQAPLEWAADQIGLARVFLARSRLGGGALPAGLGVGLGEARLVAEELGCPMLNDAATALLAEVRLGVVGR